MFLWSIQKPTYRYKKQILWSIEIWKELLQVHLCQQYVDDSFHNSALQARGYDADQNMQALVQKQITKTILKMLLGAIQQDADDRGYEICTMLENSQQGEFRILDSDLWVV